MSDGRVIKERSVTQVVDHGKEITPQPSKQQRMFTSVNEKVEEGAVIYPSPNRKSTRNQVQFE